MDLETIYSKLDAGVALSPEEEKHLQGLVSSNIKIKDRVEAIARHGEQYINAVDSKDEAGFIAQTGNAMWGAANDIVFQGIEMTHIIAETVASEAGMYKVRQPDQKKGEGEWRHLSDEEKNIIQEGKTEIDPITLNPITTYTGETIVGQPFKDWNIDRPKESGKIYEDGLRVLLRYGVMMNPSLKMAQAMKLSNAYMTGAVASAASSILATSTEDATLGNLVVDTGIINPMLRGATEAQKKDIIDFLTVTEEDTTLGAKAQVVLQDLLGEGIAVGVFKGLVALKGTKRIDALLKKAPPSKGTPFQQESYLQQAKDSFAQGKEALSQGKDKLTASFSHGKGNTELSPGAALIASDIQSLVAKGKESFSEGISSFSNGKAMQAIGEKMKIRILEKNYQTKFDPKTLTKEQQALLKEADIPEEQMLQEAKSLLNQGGVEATPILKEIIQGNIDFLNNGAKQGLSYSESFRQTAKSVEDFQSAMKKSGIAESSETLLTDAFLKIELASKFTSNGKFNPVAYIQEAKLTGNATATEHITKLGGVINAKNISPVNRAVIHGIELDSLEKGLFDFVNPQTLEMDIERLKNTGLLNGLTPLQSEKTVAIIDNARFSSMATGIKIQQMTPEFQTLYNSINSEVLSVGFNRVSDASKKQFFLLYDELQKYVIDFSNMGTASGRLLKSRDPLFIKQAAKELEDSTKALFTHSSQTPFETFASVSERKTLQEALSSGVTISKEDSRKIEMIFNAVKETAEAIKAGDESAIHALGKKKPQTITGDPIEASGLNYLGEKLHLNKLNKGMDSMVRWYQNGMLTNPATAGFNFVNGGLRYGQNTVEHLLGSVIDDLIGNKSIVSKDEAVVRISQLFTLFPEAVMTSKQAFVTGVSKHGGFRKMEVGDGLTSVIDSIDMWKEADSWSQKAMLVWNQLNEVGFRTQMSLDEFWGYMVDGGERLALSHRYAKHFTEGQVGSQAYDDLVRQLYHGDRTNPLLKEVLDGIETQVSKKKKELLFADGLVSEHSWLQTSIGGTEQSLASIFGHVRDFPVLDKLMRIQVPFYNVAVNIIRAGVELTPGLQFASKRYALAFTGKLGKEEQTLAKGRMALGAIIYGTYFAMSANGEMSGAYPSNYRQGRVLSDDNFLPFSITDGDYFHSLRGSAPADFVGKVARISYGLYEATAMAVSAGFMTKEEAQQSLDIQAELQASVITHIAENMEGLLDGNPMTQGLSNMVGLMGSNPSAKKQAQMNIATAMNPLLSVVSGARRAVADAMDPYKRDAYSGEFWDSYIRRAKASTPLFTDDLDIRVNILGEPILKYLQEWEAEDRETRDHPLPKLAIFLQGNTSSAKPRSKHPFMKELWRLKAEYEPPIYFATIRFDATQSQGIKTRKTHTYTLSREQKREWMSTTTSIVQKEIAPLIRKKWYKRLSDVEKRLELEIRIRDAKKRGRENMYALFPEIEEARQQWKEQVDLNPFPEMNFLSR